MRALAGSAIPVLEGALERSVTLAAAMDSRGYGRRGDITARERRMTSMMLLVGLVAACIGVFGLVSSDSPAYLGLPMLLLGTLMTMVAVLRAGRSRVRTRYRPDPWRAPEWAVAGAGLVTATAFSAAGWLGVPGMSATFDPPAWPTLPWIAVLALAVAVTPAWTSPPLPVASRVASESTREPVEVVA